MPDEIDDISDPLAGLKVPAEVTPTEGVATPPAAVQATATPPAAAAKADVEDENAVEAADEGETVAEAEAEADDDDDQAAEGAADGGEGDGEAAPTPAAEDPEPEPEPAKPTPAELAAQREAAAAARQREQAAMEAERAEAAKLSERRTAYETRQAALDKKLEDGTFDAIDDGKELAWLQSEHRKLADAENAAAQKKLAAIEQREEARAADQKWSAYATETGVPEAKLRTVWEECCEQVQGEPRFAGASFETLQAVASERFESRVAIIKGKATAAAATATTPPAAAATPTKTAVSAPKKPIPAAAARPVTKGGGRVLPAGTSTAPPKPKKFTGTVLDRAGQGEFGDLTKICE